MRVAKPLKTVTDLKNEIKRLTAENLRLRRERDHFKQTLKDMTSEPHYEDEEDDEDEIFDVFDELETLETEEHHYPAYVANAAVDLINFMIEVAKIYHGAYTRVTEALQINNLEQIKSIIDIRIEDSAPVFYLNALQHLSMLIMHEALKKGVSESRANELMQAMMDDITSKINKLEMQKENDHFSGINTDIKRKL